MVDEDNLPNLGNWYPCANAPQIMPYIMALPIYNIGALPLSVCTPCLYLCEMHATVVQDYVKLSIELVSKATKF